LNDGDAGRGGREATALVPGGLGHQLRARAEHWYPATFYLLLPLIGNELGLSYGQIGSILTCNLRPAPLPTCLGNFRRCGRPQGPAHGRVAVLDRLSLSCDGFSHVYWMMLVCATMVGIGNNLWHPTAIPWLATRFPERRGLVMSFHSMGGNVGDAFAPFGGRCAARRLELA